jgi:hypothetical protein
MFIYRLTIIILISLGIVACAEREDRISAFNLAEIQPIECHVQLIDQDQKPLSNVPVKVEVWSRTIDGGTQGRRELPINLTDESGHINVRGERGGYLGISVVDERYITGLYPKGFAQSWSFVLRYNHNSSQGSIRHGTAEVPAVYNVWHKEGPQPLISLTGDIRVSYVAHKPIRIDLVRGELVDDGGDLVIDIKMAETEEGRRKQADHRGIFPYDATITMTDGMAHIYEVTDDADGLISSAPGAIVTDFPSQIILGKPNPNFPDAKSASLIGFIRLRAGKIFGKAKVIVGVEPYWRTDQGRVIVRVDALLNINGSRSFEPDAARMVKLTLTDARKKSD